MPATPKMFVPECPPGVDREFFDVFVANVMMNVKPDRMQRSGMNVLTATDGDSVVAGIEMASMGLAMLIEQFGKEKALQAAKILVQIHCQFYDIK